MSRIPKVQTLLELRNAVEYLRVNRITVFRMRDKGEIPWAFKVGRVWRIDLDELMRSVEAERGRHD